MRTRSRSRTNINATPIVTYTTLGNTNVLGAVSPFFGQQNGMTQTIVDDGTPYQKGGALFKRCLDIKTSIEYNVKMLELNNLWNARRSNRYWWFCTGFGDGTNVLSPLTMAHTTLADSIVTTNSQRALQKLLPSVNEGTSIINFAIELKDLRRAGHDWQTRFKKLFHPEKFKRQSVSKISAALKESSNLILETSFGWIPFVRDLIGIYEGLRKLGGRLRWLKRNVGKRLTNRLTWPMSNTETTVLLTTGGVNAGISGNGSEVNPGYFYEQFRTVRVSETYSATLMYSYQMDNMSDMELKIRGFLDAIGVRLDPAIIWNAIPFSFLIDWVVDVSSFLRSFAIDNLGIKTEIIDFCHSVKSQLTAEYSLRFYHISDPTKDVFNPKWNVIVGTKTRYERDRATPDLHAISTSTLNGRKFVLGTALVLANRKIKTKRKARPRSPRRDVSMTESW